MLERYYSSSARFTLNGGLITLGDRGSLGQLLHGLQLAVGVEPEVLEIISSPNKCVSGWCVCVCVEAGCCCVCKAACAR
jgi:hypothetical protein